LQTAATCSSASDDEHCS